jgi:hypothetical protein
MPDLYDDTLKLLRSLNPDFAPLEGERVTLVAALINPTEDFHRLLALRRLAEDYLDSHSGQPGIECFCPLCERAKKLTNRDKKPQQMALEVA